MINDSYQQNLLKTSLESLHINSKIYYKNGGIFAKEKVSKNQVIFRIDKKDTICYSNIQQNFRQFFQSKKNTKIQSKNQTNGNKSKKKNEEKIFTINKNDLNMDQKEIILLLYLVYLNLLDQNQTKMQQSKIYEQELKQKFHQKLLSLWIKNSKSIGFAGFPSQIIHKSKDQNLIIQYHAYKNTVLQFSQRLILFIKDKVKNSLNQNNQKNWFKLFEQTSDQYLKRIIFECIQLKNTRSFGYTKQTMIIPYFDFLNHSSSENVQLKIRDSSKMQNLQQKQKIQIQKQKRQDSMQLSSDSSEEDELLQHIQIQIQAQNTHSKNQNALLNKSNQEFLEIICVKQIFQDEQLFLNYGSRNNEYLLKWYGFIQQNNPYDRIKLYYDLYKDRIYFDKIQRSTQEITFRFHSSIKNYQQLLEFNDFYKKQQESYTKDASDLPSFKEVDQQFDSNNKNINFDIWLQRIQNSFKKYRCGPKSSKGIMKLICLSKKYNQKRFYTINSFNFNRKLIFSIPQDLQFQHFSIKDLIKRLTNKQNMPFLQCRQKDTQDQSVYQKWIKAYHKQQLKIYIHHLKIIVCIGNIVQWLIKLKKINQKQISVFRENQNSIENNNEQLTMKQYEKERQQIRLKLQQLISKIYKGLYDLGDYMILIMKII